MSVNVKIRAFFTIDKYFYLLHPISELRRIK